jgi:hypothetical protein
MINKYFAFLCVLAISTACGAIPEEQYAPPPVPTTNIANNFEFVFPGFEGVEPGPEPCSDDKIREVVEPASEGNDSVLIDCDLSLESGQKIEKRLIFEGSNATGVDVNCNFATIDGRDTVNSNKDMIEVRSHFDKENEIFNRPFPLTLVGSDFDKENEVFTRPSFIRIKDCIIFGSVRVWGMSRANGTPFTVANTGLFSITIIPFRISSQSLGHTERARDNAPAHIVFDNLTITGLGRVPLYFSPGVNNSMIINSDIVGKSDSVAIYLDAESYMNTIKNNYIDVKTSREVLAIDGSSFNHIVNNRFSGLNNGGIYLYRNCGEEGTVRHATPSHNQIINNTFYYKKYDGPKPSVYFGYRNGQTHAQTVNNWIENLFADSYCPDDDGYDFGSSLSDYDYATHNVFMQNQIIKRSLKDMIKTKNKDINKPNFVNYNETVTEDTVVYFRFAGCYVSEGYKDFILDGETIDVFKDDGQLTCPGFEYTCHDGDLIQSSNSSCEFSEVPFNCKVSGDNGGCERFVFCPSGQRILAAVAACNLEYGDVKDSDLESIPVGNIRVIKTSDNVSSSSCYVGNNTLAKDEKPIVGIDGLYGVVVGCDEFDQNGGDCQNRGVLYCH